MATPYRRRRTGRLGGLLAAFAMCSAVALADGEPGPLPPLKVDAAKAELGKRLFFDTRLSGDAAISCASCHVPENGFAHPDALAPGYPGNKHFRNAPTLINTAHKKVWMHDGRLGTNLNDVTREMIVESYIMNMDMRIMQERLKQDPEYVRLFEAAGFGEPSNGGARNAIPEYLNTLTSRGAPFDGGTMSAAAQRGYTLFKGKAGCIQCHNGALFSDEKAHKLGVPENYDIFRDPLRHQAFIAYNKFVGTPNYMGLKRDLGVYVQNREVAGAQKRKGAFITPTLRELKYTAPYMHNGVLRSLRDVIEFYNRGGGNVAHRDPAIRPLRLIESEKNDLLAFLDALSGAPLAGPQYVWDQPYPSSYSNISDWQNARN